MRQSAKRSLVVALVALTWAQSGCGLFPTRAQPSLSPAPSLYSAAALEAAQSEFAHAVALEQAEDERCVDAYFRTAALAWQSRNEEAPGPGTASSWHWYHESVARLMVAGQRFGRLDPARALVVREGDQEVAVPVVHRGFPWAASDFQRLHAPPTGDEPMLQRRYGCQGIGVPLVVERCRNKGNPIEERFFPEKSFFGATAVLRLTAASAPVGETTAFARTATLEFHNPLPRSNIQADANPLPLASDLSAPLALMLEVAPRSYFAGFIEPGGAATAARLTVLDPYQPGKVPVVLVHGLFSDPLSWADLVNDLRATPGFEERYQIWFFRYATGQGFLQSAAKLRTELRAAVKELDPNRRDPALRRIVLIGHSMGGLIAKLQATYSDELIWSRLANRPLQEIVTTEATRALLAETCFFDPSPDVARVIFIAAPHAGSLCSSSLVGRGAALLVEPSPEQAAIHDQLVRDNSGVFNPAFEERLPTSIDMLAPKSPLLEAMRQMRFGAGVRLHNIVGVSHPVSLDGPSDGVVSIHSASHPGCQSVLAVGTLHGRVHRACQTSAEILRILGCDWSGQADPRLDEHPAVVPESILQREDGSTRAR